MSEENSLHDFDAVARRLKSEALAERPDFSPSLHAQILAAIHSQSRPASGVRRQEAPAARRWLSVAVAIACVAAWFSFLGRDMNADRSEQPAIAQIEPAAIAPAELADMAGLPGKWSADLPSLIDVAMSSQQWAYLDHDAQLAIETLADHLPLDWGN